MNNVSVVISEKRITVGDIRENFEPGRYGLKGKYDGKDFIFSGELTDQEFDTMIGVCKACPLSGCYDVYKNGEKVW